MSDVIFDGPDSLERFARFVERKAVEFELPFVAASEAISHVVHKNVLGVFGDSSKLQDLAPATQDERARLGFTENDPLLRDGTLLRDSVERVHEGLLAGAASDEPIMADHEFGYINARTGRAVPPRPVFEIGLKESEVEIEALLVAAVDAALGGKA